MKTGSIEMGEDALISIQKWLDTHPTAIIKFIIGTPADGRPLIVIYDESIVI